MFNKHQLYIYIYYIIKQKLQTHTQLNSPHIEEEEKVILPIFIKPIRTKKAAAIF